MFARLIVPMTAWQVTFIATSAFVGVYVIEQFGASTATASLPLVLFPAAGALGTLLGGALADRVGRLVVIRLGYVVALAGAVVIAVAPTAWIVVVATCLVGGGVFMPFAPQLTLAHSYLPRRMGTASGLSIGLTSAIGGLLTAALGHVADAAGLRVVFGVLAAFLVVGVVGAFTLQDPAARALPEPVDPALTTADAKR
jgi:FSR family fosmidomycin resistance protein-like MFS transporter